MLRRLAMPLVKAPVTEEVVDYLARHARQDAVLERVARETAAMPRAEMATTPDEAALLTLLARLVGARSALEVGTFTGYGAISIARGLGAGGRLKCLELDEKYAAIARRNLEDAGVAERVEIIVGPALESLRAMPAEPSYDYIFLDDRLELLEVAALGGDLGGDDELLLGDGGLGVVGGDEVAAELHPACVGVGGVDLALGQLGRLVWVRRAAEAAPVLHHSTRAIGLVGTVCLVLRCASPR